MAVIIDKILSYLHNVLGIRVVLVSWEREKALPFLLRNTYAFYRMDLMSLECLVMVNRDDRELSPAVIMKHMNMARGAWPSDIIYVKEHVTSYNRKRLIEQKLPFIVPDRQMYLPMLAIDLREHFLKKGPENVRRLSPSAQVLALLCVYQNKTLSDEDMTPTRLAKILGYSKMTMGRAFKDLQAIFSQTDLSDCMTSLKGIDLWNTLQPFLQSPVKSSFFVHMEKTPSTKGLFLAGLPALAELTFLTAPTTPVFAFSTSEWKTFSKQHTLEITDHEDTNVCEIEIWTYSPSLLSQKQTVDPLSLYLSLMDSEDERVEIERDKLLEAIV